MREIPSSESDILSEEDKFTNQAGSEKSKQASIEELEKELGSKETIDFIDRVLRSFKGVDEPAREDVRQQALLKALKAVQKGAFKGPIKSFFPWIGKIATNEMLSRFSYNKRRDTTEIKGKTGESIESYSDDLEDISHLLENKRTRIILTECIDNLNDASRPVMKLLLEGYTNKEIADRLNINHRTITTRIFRAVRKIKAMLKKKGITKEDLLDKAA